MPAASEICVFGAGSIGCYLGGRLAASGSRVTFVGRPRLANEIRQHGLHVTDYCAADLRVAPAEVRFVTEPSGASAADLVLVTVKSAGTADAATELAKVLKPGAIVASFQNGVHNAELLRERLPGRTVLTGMVPFNVLHRGGGAFHQGTGGDLMIDAHPAVDAWRDAFVAAGLRLRTHPDMHAVQWGKLLINLKNAINALAGVPIVEELSNPAFRECWALAQLEALDLLDAASIKPARATPLPPRWLPYLLRLPNFIFLRVKMVKVDPLARSSMWEDLEAGRATEVDYLNGEIVRLADQLGRAAPINARLVALILEAEQGGRRDWTGEELLAELRRAA